MENRAIKLLNAYKISRFDVVNSLLGYNIKVSHGETKEYTREEFRESIYPKMIEKLKNEKEYYEYNYDIESYNKALSNLNKVYHLSD